MLKRGIYGKDEVGDIMRCLKFFIIIDRDGESWGLSIIIRVELGLPGFIICSSFSYNSCITFHGIFMIFFFIMPLLIGGYGNLLIPIMICSSDMIFPRLNALSLWLSLVLRNRFNCSIGISRLCIRFSWFIFFFLASLFLWNEFFTT